MVVLFVVLLGALSGIAYATGFTIVGLEVDDDTRGRVFAFFQSSIQVILLTVIAVVPLLSYALTKVIAALNGTGNVKIGNITYASAGQNAVILLAAMVAFLLGLRAYRQMDDRKGVPLREDLLAAIRSSPAPAVLEPVHLNGSAPAPAPTGRLSAFEGGEGSGKTTQARLIAIWLRELGYDVVTTHEPGATKIGMRLRALLLDTSHTGMSPHAEALMYAADRAEHVASVIAPALDRGAIVITDRYVDSSSPTRARAGTCRSRRSPGSTGGRPADAPPTSPSCSHRTPSPDEIGGPARPTGWKPNPRSSTCGSAPDSSSWPAPNRDATSYSTRPARPVRSPGTSRTGSAACSPTRFPWWRRRIPETSRRSRKRSVDRGVRGPRRAGRGGRAAGEGGGRGIGAAGRAPVPRRGG